MTPTEETAYTEGSRMTWLLILRRCLKELGYEDPEAKAALFAVEREETVQQLRTICREFGDNDWPESLHLGDVIDKHLGRHLHAKEPAIKDLELLAGNIPLLRTRQQIEDLLTHCREGHCAGSPVEIATMISTLEWVLRRTAEPALPSPEHQR